MTDLRLLAFFAVLQAAAFGAWVVFTRGVVEQVHGWTGRVIARKLGIEEIEDL